MRDNGKQSVRALESGAAQPGRCTATQSGWARSADGDWNPFERQSGGQPCSRARSGGGL